MPLPGSPLKALNSYVIRGSDRSLIIDTGFNRDECLTALLAGLAEIGVEPARADIFITHLHVDHLGLAGRLSKGTTRVFFAQTEWNTVLAWTGWDAVVDYAVRNGFPAAEARTSVSRHPGFKYGLEQAPEPTLVRDGDVLPAGPYRFRCVETPGHTPGHTCLYEPDGQILISGDHILGDITPNIQCWSDQENPLRDYLASLDQVSPLEVKWTLPGHRSLVVDHRARIRQLKEHHRLRAEEVLTALSARPATAFEVAARLTWDIDCDSWAEFPIGQKWFALGETISHLRFLEEGGEIRRDGGGTPVRFRRTDRP